MRIGLQEESDIGVADPLADHLRGAYAAFERTGRDECRRSWKVIRESPAAARSIRFVRWAAKTTVA